MYIICIYLLILSFQHENGYKIFSDKYSFNFIFYIHKMLSKINAVGTQCYIHQCVPPLLKLVDNVLFINISSLLCSWYTMYCSPRRSGPAAFPLCAVASCICWTPTFKLYRNNCLKKRSKRLLFKWPLNGRFWIPFFSLNILSQTRKYWCHKKNCLDYIYK